MNLYDNYKIDFTKEKLFFGEGKNTQRFDVLKYPWLDQSNDKQQGLDWKHDEVNMTNDGIDFNTRMPMAEKFIYTRVLQKLIFLDSLQGRAPFLTFGQIATLPELENVILTWTYFEGCLVPETEVLTTNGWKRIDQITLDDKVMASDINGVGNFVNPKEIHIYDYNDNISKFEGKNVSQFVTKQHRMLLQDRKGKRFVKRVQDIETPSNVLTYGMVNALSNTKNNERKLTTYERFLIVLQADGSIYKEYTNEDGKVINKNRNGKNGFISTTFSFKKERKINRLVEILKELNFEYTLVNYENNKEQTLITVKVPNDLIISKSFNDWITLEELTYDFSREFINELKYWDGWDYENPTFGYDTANQENAKLVEIIGFIGGYKTSFNIQKSNEINEKDCYRLTFNSKKNYSARNKIIRTEEYYNGKVYCLSVEGEFFTIRHNGKVSITGNCKHSRTYTHNLRNVYDNPSKIFDESFEIEELNKLADSISGPYNKLYDLIIDYLYFRKHSFPISEEFMYNIKKQLLLALININILEGVRFYSGFACIWGMTESQGFVSGTSKNLSLICRDENQHLALTQKLLSYLKNNKDEGFVEIYKDIEPDIYKMYEDAYKEEFEWIDYLFSKGSYIGLNSNMIKQYITHIVYKRMKAIGLEPFNKEHVKNPLPWVDKYISGDETEVLAQESEITNYITGGISNLEEINKDELKKLLY